MAVCVDSLQCRWASSPEVLNITCELSAATGECLGSSGLFSAPVECATEPGFQGPFLSS